MRAKIIAVCIVLLGLISPFVSMGQEQASKPVKKAPNVIWRERADTITAGCKTDYSKCLAIYKWVCRKIRYDYSYKVYTAEECWKKHKGVCQAFSELYVKLAKGCGVEARIIGGNGRGDSCGYYGIFSHAWVAAKTEKGTILIEPTWGSSALRSVSYNIKDSLKREKFIMHYFDVKPEAMIFNHFPDCVEDQFLAKPITEEQFRALPDFFRAELFVYHGVNAKALLSYFLKHPNDSTPKRLYLEWRHLFGRYKIFKCSF